MYVPPSVDIPLPTCRDALSFHSQHRHLCSSPKLAALLQASLNSASTGWAQAQSSALGIIPELPGGCLGRVTSPMFPHAVHPLPLPNLPWYEGPFPGQPPAVDEKQWLELTWGGGELPTQPSQVYQPNSQKSGSDIALLLLQISSFFTPGAVSSPFLLLNTPHLALSSLSRGRRGIWEAASLRFLKDSWVPTLGSLKRRLTHPRNLECEGWERP